MLQSFGQHSRRRRGGPTPRPAAPASRQPSAYKRAAAPQLSDPTPVALEALSLARTHYYTSTGNLLFGMSTVFCEPVSWKLLSVSSSRQSKATFQIGSGPAPHGTRHFDRCTQSDYTAASLSRSRSHIDRIVARGDDIEVVFHHDHRIAEADQPVELRSPIAERRMDAAPWLVHREHTTYFRRLRYSSVASLILWASPPDNSVAGWPRRKYPRPTW
jgi:hypothetical protein